MKVGIAGVGGIGSNTAVALIRAGFLDLKLVDFDRVESSNLNRQFYFYDQVGEYKVNALRDNLLRINPAARIETQVLQLDNSNILSALADCRVLVEGFDGSRAKKMVLECFGGQEVRVVSACGIAGRNLQNIQQRQLGNSIIVGDFRTDVQQAELYCPKIQIISAIMADCVVRAVREMQ